MGGVADTSAIVACERMGWSARQSLSYLSAHYDDHMVLPAIVAAELIHGIYHAQTPQHSDRRRQFVLDIFQALPPVPFTADTSWIAGRLRGEQSKAGNTLPFADSLIAATAIELHFSVITANLQDFTRIPNLRVIPFTLP